MHVRGSIFIRLKTSFRLLANTNDVDKGEELVEQFQKNVKTQVEDSVLTHNQEPVITKETVVTQDDNRVVTTKR